ncbi:restriction endonuclease subunit S, partial [Candidatus Saccharibacteria bacterium]|nr:restriction endonuclease subunit S [Candidatus Saccharibacteria bacterium]
LFRQRNEKVSDKDYEPLSVTKLGIVPQLEDAAKTNDGDNRKKVLKGDFVINSRSDRKGSSGLSNLDGSVSLINIVLADGEPYPRYTHHLLRSYPFQEEFYRWGQGIVADLWSTNYQRMKVIQLPIPDNQTQKRIAGYLDKETAKIDKLITDQERLLELLGEKREAEIAWLVTKGTKNLNETKNSGIDGIGDIPSHWDIVRTVVLFSENRLLNNNLETKNALKYRFGEITSKELTSDFNFEELRRYKLVKENDIMVNGLNLNYDFVTQRVALVGEAGCITPAYIALRPRDVIRPKYASLLLKSLDAQKVLNGWGTGIRLTLNFSEFKKTYLCLPPLNEQDDIIAACDDISQKFEKLSLAIKRELELLKERRVSLISNVVTGKVKV